MPLRECHQCHIKLPPYRSRTRHPETGALVCDGCHPNKAGSEGRPVGFHGSKTATAACDFCDGRGVIGVAGGTQDCPECGGDTSREASWAWGEDPGPVKNTYRCTQHWTDSATACGPDHPCEECGATSLKGKEGFLARLFRREAAQDDSELDKGLAADLVREFEGRAAPEAGEIAVVYRDLSGAPKSGYPAKGSWSIKRRGPQGGRTGHVYAHTIGLHLRNVRPEFDEAARWKATDTTKRAPFAYLSGQVVAYTRSGGGREVSFYPDLGHFFLVDDRTILRSASDAYFINGKCFVQGAQTSTETVPRSIFEVCPDCGATPATWCAHATEKLADRFPAYQAGKRMSVVAGLHDDSWSLLMQVVAHDSGDGQTVYHCPFCGAGQTVARSDGTTECGFCHTYFTVQVQPEHSAMPQTDPATGQPLDMPGMPGDPSQAEAPTPTPTETTAPAGGGDFAPAGSGGPEGFAPAGQGPVEQFAPAGSRAASRRTATPGRPEMQARVLRMMRESDERQGYTTRDCLECEGQGQVGGGFLRPPRTCIACEGQGYTRTKQASRRDLTTATRTTAFYLTPDQVALPEPSYLAHLALRFAEDRAAVVQQVRNERAAQ